MQNDRNCEAYAAAQAKAKSLKVKESGWLDRETLDTLTRCAMAKLQTGMHPRRGIEKLVLKYFGQEVGIMSARKDLMCNEQRYYEYKALVYGAMNELGERAEALMKEAKANG